MHVLHEVTQYLCFECPRYLNCSTCLVCSCMVFGQLLIHVLFGRTENLDNELGCVSSSEGGEGGKHGI